MGAFLGISLWIALAMVIPGLVTITCLYFAGVTVNPQLTHSFFVFIKDSNDWIISGLAITIMILTQSFGILLEKLMIKNRLLGPESKNIKIAEGIDPCGSTAFELKPYNEYDGMYILLAELDENEDTQGHLKRCLAQYFLTNNSMISFIAGIVLAYVILFLDFQMEYMANAAIFIGISSFLLFVIYQIAVIRFEVMTKALWAARQRRVALTLKKNVLSVEQKYMRFKQRGLKR